MGMGTVIGWLQLQLFGTLPWEASTEEYFTYGKEANSTVTLPQVWGREMA
jgi:hypothetical protein